MGSRGDGQLQPGDQGGALPLGPHLVDELPDRGRARLDLSGGEVPHRGGEHVVQGGYEQGLSRGEVVQQRASAHPGAPTDLLGRGARVAALHEGLHRRLEEGAPGRFRTGLSFRHRT